MRIPPVDVLVQSRRSLHSVAEHVLAAAQMRATGEIGLQPGDHGFQTPPLDGGDRVVALTGTDILVFGPDHESRAPLTTVRAAALHVGVEPGFPGTDPPATPLEPDAPLELDEEAVSTLLDWFALGRDALDLLCVRLADESPSRPVLFPEHFDIGVTSGKVNYGASPGDETVRLPYVYVGPHGGAPSRDDFWNAEFGAYRTIEEVGSADDALAFFLTGRDRLLSGGRMPGTTPGLAYSSTHERRPDTPPHLMGVEGAAAMVVVTVRTS